MSATLPKSTKDEVLDTLHLNPKSVVTVAQITRQVCLTSHEMPFLSYEMKHELLVITITL